MSLLVAEPICVALNHRAALDLLCFSFEQPDAFARADLVEVLNHRIPRYGAGLVVVLRVILLIRGVVAKLDDLGSRTLPTQRLCL